MTKRGGIKEWLLQPGQRLPPESIQRATGLDQRKEKMKQTCSSLKAALLRRVTLLSPYMLNTG